MEFRTIDNELLAKMIIAGANSLNERREWINQLNVFPVPDGDTGTNMCMTIFSAINEMESIADPDMAKLSKAISSGSLRGARGNSGVILSQLMRGFAKSIENCRELDKIVVSDSLQKACDTAYKAVMRPKEGTILTVARAAADKALELSCVDSCSMEQFLDAIVEEAERVLQLTPDMLSVLKEAGVVDSGGQGLVEILKGARDAFCGKDVNLSVSGEIPAPNEEVNMSAAAMSTNEIVFGYCTEFIINLDSELSEEEESEYRAFLNSVGDSIVLVAEDEIAKTHVHTNDPGLVLQKALTLGSLTSIKIDNMRVQHQEILFEDTEKLAKEQSVAEKPSYVDEEPASPAAEALQEKDVGFIAVSVGDGLNEAFKAIGADYIIEGGQTMNPSTEDILEAIEQVNAPTVFVFPNNKNIIMAANQAASMESDKEVIVIPTRTLPQGITALINFVPEFETESNRDLMIEAMDMVKTGQVTYAIRDTVYDGLEINEGDYMGIGDTSILSAGQDLAAVAREMVSEMIDDTSSFICVYYGEDVDRDDAEALKSCLEEDHPECEVEVQNGGQPVYYYIISIE